MYVVVRYVFCEELMGEEADWKFGKGVKVR